MKGYVKRSLIYNAAWMRLNIAWECIPQFFLCMSCHVMSCHVKSIELRCSFSGGFLMPYDEQFLLDRVR